LSAYDLLVAIFLALHAWMGYRAGLVRRIIGLAGLVVGLALAFRFDAALARLVGSIHSLSPAGARAVAFFAILLLVWIATSVAGLLVGGVLARLPVLGTLNRLGGLTLGLVLGLLAVWLVTVAVVFLPASFASVARTVDRSFAARIVRSATPNGQHLISSYVGHFSAGHASQAVQKEMRLLLGLPAKAGH
jgi:uncharacterized membrane protein required for colicin V production